MTNWRTTVLGIVIAFALYFQQAGMKLPETGHDWLAFGVGFIVFVGLTLMKDPDWLVKLTGGTLAKPLAGVVLVLACVACANQQASLAELQAKIDAQKAQIIPKLQAGIAYAHAIGYIELENCQQAWLVFLQQPASSLPDFTNPFIDQAIAHQVLTSDLRTSPLLGPLFRGCAAYNDIVKDRAIKTVIDVSTLLAK